MSKTVIFGAGLAGLLAACKFPDSQIYEAGPERTEHRALLRFRDEGVSRLTGIPFKKVSIQKAVWDSRRQELITGHCPLNIANQYSLKVTGNLVNRSVHDLSPSVRWIAPDDFHQQLTERFRSIISFETPVTDGDVLSIRDLIPNRPMISTIPLKAMCNMMGLNIEGAEFRMEPEPIMVNRYKLKFPVADVYQTVYFPQPSMQVYRASITGDELIIEGTCGQPEYYAAGELSEILRAFGLDSRHIDIDSHEQRVQKYGKIVGLDRKVREALLYELTARFNLFSLGRFACWRNILLDDVARDLDRMETMINSTMYAKHLHFFGEHNHKLK